MITVTFSEPVKIGNGYIEFTTAHGNAVAFNRSISGNVLTITPINLLSYGVKYVLTLHTG